MSCLNTQKSPTLHNIQKKTHDENGYEGYWPPKNSLVGPNWCPQMYTGKLDFVPLCDYYCVLFNIHVIRSSYLSFFKLLGQSSQWL